MKSLNRVTLLGNMASDPESRTMPNGNTLCTFSIATTNKWKDKQSGEWKEKGEFHRCIAFAKLGEVADEYLAKGMPIFAEGRLQTRSWDKDGQKHYGTEIVLSDFQMLGSKRDGDAARRAPSAPSSDAPPALDGFEDDDIPF